MVHSQSITLPLLSSFEKAAGELVKRRKPPQTSRSPLRYPGGKTRAVKTIMHLIPEETKKLCSPFFGGGSIELACSSVGIRVYGADAFKPVVEFWQQAIKNPVLLSEYVRAHHPLSRAAFYKLQRSYTKLDNALERAAVFYVLNRSSFSGTTLSGGMSPNHPRFTLSAIERLRDLNIKGLSVRHADFRKTLKQHEDKFLYLDPPYANGGKLYGRKGDMHEEFSHEELADALNQRDGWILSYNNCRFIRKLYKGHKFIVPEWVYGMSADKSSNEVLIVNA